MSKTANAIRTMFRTTTLLMLFACVNGPSVAPARSETPLRPALKRSDVVFLYDNPSLYEAYGCTVLGWGQSVPTPGRLQLAHTKGVRLFAESVGFLTEFSRVIDFSPDFLDAACRNFAGQPFIVPWLWDFRHRGQPSWWWCTNSPLYRKYLESRLEEVVRAKADGLHIDDYSGTFTAVTWGKLSGCFCRHCMAGFRDYLAKNLSKDILAALGIRDLGTFDYRAYLLARGVKAEDYDRRRSQLPLAGEFYDFQVTANTEFVTRFHRRAEKLRGVPMSLAVNSNLGSPAALAIAPHLTYFCCEVETGAAARAVPMHPVYVYKLADGLSRPGASTTGGWDWAYVSDHKLPGLVRTWIALSYAFGHNFMVPHYQWCYTDKRGSFWYSGPTEEYAWLYRFVRQNARLLDGYEAVAPVAVVYDNAARRRQQADVEPICTALAERNVPFTIVVAGDDWLDYRLDAASLARRKAVIVAERLVMDKTQRELLAAIDRAGRLVRWPDDKRLEQLVPAPVRLEGVGDMLVVPRELPGNTKSSLVVHLLNRRYDGQKDAMTLQTNLMLRPRHDFVGGRKFARAMLHAPQTPSIPLRITFDGQDPRIEVPRLDLWAILELNE